MIEAIKLRKEYSSGSVVTPVLREVSFKIEEGEFVGIVGTSGSGKSTLLNIIGLLDAPTGGSYLIDEKQVSDISKDEMAQIRNQKIGFVFQRYNLLPRTSVLENVILPTIYDPNIKREEAEQKARELLKKVDLLHRLDNRPNELSGGESQRVAIARALINNPSLILADEPTGNLGYKNTEPIMNLFKELNKEGHTILLVTHSKDIASYASRILHLTKGIIKEELPPSFDHKNSGKE
jgi:putative ABC transport system ATP-binding protein